jgi:hypothetical protein
MALGIEEVPVVPSGGLHRPLSSLVLPLLDRYMVRGKIYSSPNLYFTRIRNAINQDTASNSELQEAYNLLRTRLKADEHATLITSYYNPAFVERHSIEHWDGRMGHFIRFLSKEDWASFMTVFDRFLYDCQDRHPNPAAYRYTRPRDYALAAAIDCGLSPSELEERLELIPEDTWNASMYPSSSGGTLGSSGSWQSLDDVRALVEKVGDSEH